MAKRILPLIPPSLVVDQVQQSKESISVDGSQMPRLSQSFEPRS